MLTKQYPAPGGLEDLICDIMNDAEPESVSDYLSCLPRTRESAEELLDAIISYDAEEIYAALLTEFDDLLTADELKHVRQRYTKCFDTSLPGFPDDGDGL